MRITYEFIHILAVLLCTSTVCHGQYSLQREQYEGNNTSHLVLKQVGSEQIPFIDLDTVRFGFGTHPQFEMIGTDFFGAGIYISELRHGRNAYRFVFEKFQIREAGVVHEEKYVFDLLAPKGWHPYYSLKIADQTICISLSEHGDYTISSSFDLAHYEAIKLMQFVKRFKWMAHRPIPTGFRYLQSNQVLKAL
jgi:hypothetical protein